MKKYTIYISQVYEFQDTIEVEAEDVNQAQAMALEQFCCDWENAIHHADQTTIAFLDAEETEARKEVQALEAKFSTRTTGPGNASPLAGEEKRVLDEKDGIHVYPFAQALADGVLVDAGRTAWEAGIKYPVALTGEVWCRFVEVPDGIEGQDEQGRLSDLLNALSGEYETRAGSASEVIFQLQVRNNNRKPELVTLKAVCGRDDDGSPCITVMIPDND